jgi:hypothetical protein
MARSLIWIANPKFQGFGCSKCSWVFEPSGPLVGVSLEVMKKDYEVQRDREFAKHVCKPQSTKENLK